MTIYIHSCAGGVISKSRNLRGVNERIRRIGPSRTSIEVQPRFLGKASVSFRWADGSWAVADFASYSVATEWVKARRLKGADITIHVIAPTTQE